MASSEVIKALAVCAELCGANLSDGAARVIVAELEGEVEEDVLSGLTAMRRGHDGRFSLSAVLRYIREAKTARLASQSTCWMCGARATHPGPLCADHYESERKFEAQRIASFVPTALIPRAKA